MTSEPFLGQFVFKVHCNCTETPFYKILTLIYFPPEAWTKPGSRRCCICETMETLHLLCWRHRAASLQRSKLFHVFITMHDVVQISTFSFCFCLCFFFFLRTQTKVWGAVLQLGSPRPLVLSSSRVAFVSHLPEDLLGDHILNSHFLHREQRSLSGEVGHSEVWWTQRNKRSWTKKTHPEPPLSHTLTS